MPSLEDRAHTTSGSATQQAGTNATSRMVPPPTDLGMHVNLGEWLQSPRNPTAVQATTGSETIEDDESGASATGHSAQANVVRSKPKWILWVLAIIAMAVVATILGSVFGTRHRKAITAPAPQFSNSSISVPSPRQSQRHIAAFSFTEKSTLSTHVYFQDDRGQLLEAANSASNATWNIRETGVSGKNGTAIAAAVSRPSFPLELHVFYLDVNNLLNDASYRPSTDTWSPGSLADKGYTAMPNSSLTAMYNQCQLCANTTLIAFQDQNGFIQVGNLTSQGWNLQQLGPALDPVIGTGLAMQPFYREGLKDQINLYHQKLTLNMSLASWMPAALNNGADGWIFDVQVYSIIPLASPIAAAASFTNISDGYETWIEVLFLSSQGIRVSTWSGMINDWLQQNTQPSAMTNSSSNHRIYSNVAVTATGHAFAVVMQEGQADSIESWMVGEDLLDWTFNGTVDLGGSWG